jgi:thiol-disulfide isomerase/thioredoxin
MRRPASVLVLGSIAAGVVAALVVDPVARAGTEARAPRSTAAPSSSLPPLPSPTSSPVIGGAAWLGVHMAAAKGGKAVVATHVVRGSPAARAGLTDGDRIEKVGATLVQVPSDVSSAVAIAGAGSTITLSIKRGASSMSLPVVLAQRPSDEDIFRNANIGQLLPALPSLVLASGTGPVAYPALDGHVVLVDLFATWCGPCAQLGPHYASFHAKYGGKGLVVLGVSREDAALLAGWSKQNAVPYSIASDPSDTIFERVEAPALPSSLLVDKHGVVRDVFVGFSPPQVVATEQRIQALLAEP